MEPALKQRLVGAVVISALAIYFLPKFIVGYDKDNPAADVSLQVPGAPDRNFETRELPLTGPGATPPGGVVGMNTGAPPLPSTALPTVAPTTDANGAPLPVDPNAPVVSPLAGTNNPATPSVAVPTAQGALPAAQVATPLVQPAPNGAAPVVTTPTPSTAPPVALPSAPIPAASAGGHYVVSAGIYSNGANAQSLVASLKAAQLPAYAESVSANGKASTRVRIGPFAQRGDAEAARLQAQQVRRDITTSVTALDAAVAAPAPAFNNVAGKPVLAPSAIKPAAANASAPLTTASTSPATTKPPIPAPSSPAVPSPAAAGRGYVVQVSAFHSEDDALALRNRLRAAGFTAFSERVQTDSGTLFRVRIGPVANRDAADQLRASLSQKTSLSGMVVAFP